MGFFSSSSRGEYFVFSFKSYLYFILPPYILVGWTHAILFIIMNINLLYNADICFKISVTWECWKSKSSVFEIPPSSDLRDLNPWPWNEWMPLELHHLRSLKKAHSRVLQFAAGRLCNLAISRAYEGRHDRTWGFHFPEKRAALVFCMHSYYSIFIVRILIQGCFGACISFNNFIWVFETVKRKDKLKISCWVKTSRGSRLAIFVIAYHHWAKGQNNYVDSVQER